MLKVIYNTILKTLIYPCKGAKKTKIPFPWSAGRSAVNIGRTAILSGAWIKFGTKLLDWNENSKAALMKK